jgi:hypothetical protein
MWKETFKEVFKFLFDNPVIFLIILGNYALAFLFGPTLGFVGFFFISLFYLVGLHGDLKDLWGSVKRLSRWAFFVAIVLYFLYLAVGFVSHLIYDALNLVFEEKPTESLLFTALYSLGLALLIHPLWVSLFASQSPAEFFQNLKMAFSSLRKQVGALVLLWIFLFLTITAGMFKFPRFTVGEYSVLASFWLTYYTFLGVKALKRAKEEV